MPNGIYALANPVMEGATLSIDQEFNMLSSGKISSNTTYREIFDVFFDEPNRSVYEENKTKVAISWGIAALAVVAGLAIAATVVTGGAGAGLAVVATAALVGAISAGANYVSQKASNKLNGDEQEIDWEKVFIAGFAGAISGAVAVSPVGVGGQMIVNAALGGAVSYTEGDSLALVLTNMGIGALVGKLGGAGPEWSGNTNIFIPESFFSTEGIHHSVRLRPTGSAVSTFKNLWRGLNADEYIGDVFGGIWKGFFKGLVTSNVTGTLSSYYLEKDRVENFCEDVCDFIEDVGDFWKNVWDKYKPDFL